MSTTAVHAFLDSFSATLASDEQAASVVDGTGWHISLGLRVPGNMMMVLLPPCAPELNPVEWVWLDMCERFLSYYLYAGYTAVFDAAYEIWNRISPERLQSITSYP